VVRAANAAQSLPLQAGELSCPCASAQFPDLRYWSELDKGGHLAAFEQPVTFVEEVRAAFRAFR